MLDILSHSLRVIGVVSLRRVDRGGNAFKYFSEVKWGNEQVKEFANYWRTLAEPGMLPHQAQINPAAIPRLLPGITIYELRDNRKIICRLMGTGLVDHFGRDFTDKNILSWFSATERNGAEKLLRDMGEKQFGIQAHVAGYTESGNKVAGVSVGFPALDHDGQARRLLFYTNSKAMPKNRDPRLEKVTEFKIEQMEKINLQ